MEPQHDDQDRDLDAGAVQSGTDLTRGSRVVTLTFFKAAESMSGMQPRAARRVCRPV